MPAHCNISHPMKLRNSFAAASKSIRYAFVENAMLLMSAALIRARPVAGVEMGEFKTRPLQ